MKIALCSTTIHIPHTLHLLRKCSSDVKFFVVGDERSPHQDIIANQAGLGEYDYLLPGAQEKWKCSAAIGFNTLARRNIAFLEALKWGADVIYSWDTDNLPVHLDHFDSIARLLLTRESVMTSSFNGLKASGADRWLDPGFLLDPRTKHRGIPHDVSRMITMEPVTNAKIGVAAGLVLGDPDCDATTRMERHPDIQQVTQLGMAGIVVDRRCWTVFNSQNTAVIRELMPAWFMMPGVGRMDDIYASLIVQRVARERGYHVHFGQPLAYQQRHAHNLVTDLRAEIDGYENVRKLAAFLDAMLLPGKSVIEDACLIYSALRYVGFIPVNSASAGLDWIEDVGSVL
jgi:hypothetical protein